MSQFRVKYGTVSQTPNRSEGLCGYKSGLLVQFDEKKEEVTFAQRSLWLSSAELLSFLVTLQCSKQQHLYSRPYTMQPYCRATGDLHVAMRPCTAAIST